MLAGRGSIFAALLVCASGCSGELTQLVVIVDSDIDVPDDLDAVRIAVTGPNDMEQIVDQVVGPSGEPLPITLGLTPRGDALGPITVTATGLGGGSEIVSQTRTTTLVRGQSRVLRLFLSRNCRDVTCDAGQTCDDSNCVGVVVPGTELEIWTGDPTADQCDSDGDCDDDLGCTDDQCDDGRCRNSPDDSECSDGPGGRCDPTGGCMYEACDAESCDDGNPCTDDSCGDTGCEYSNNSDSCDDGVFCNGADTCDGGSCDDHAGDPCPGSSTCDEGMGTCTGCVDDSGCPDPIPGTWTACDYGGDTCLENGTRDRPVMSFTCTDGTCEATTSTESEACSRTTRGDTCGMTTTGTWSACAGFSDVCDETGSRSRMVTDRECRRGSCTDVTTTETDPACPRTTTGVSCGTTMMGSWTCGGFSDMCDESGTETRPVTTYACAGGSCNDTTMTESRPCMRTTGGMSWGSGLVCFGGSCVRDRTVTAQTDDDNVPEARLTITCRSTGASCTVEGTREASCGTCADCQIQCPEGDTVDVCCSNGSVPCGGSPSPPAPTDDISDFGVSNMAGDTCPRVGSSRPIMCMAQVGGSNSGRILCEFD